MTALPKLVPSNKPPQVRSSYETLTHMRKPAGNERWRCGFSAHKNSNKGIAKMFIWVIMKISYIATFCVEGFPVFCFQYISKNTNDIDKIGR